MLQKAPRFVLFTHATCYRYQLQRVASLKDSFVDMPLVCGNCKYQSESLSLDGLSLSFLQKCSNNPGKKGLTQREKVLVHSILSTVCPHNRVGPLLTNLI